MVSSVVQIAPDAQCAFRPVINGADSTRRAMPVSTCYSDSYVSPSIDQVHDTGHLKCFRIVFCMSSASSTDANQIENTLPPSPCCTSYLNFISLSIGIIDWLDHQTSGSHPLITHYCVSRLAGFQHQLSPRLTLWSALSWRITLVANLVNHLCRHRYIRRMLCFQHGAGVQLPVYRG